MKAASRTIGLFWLFLILMDDPSGFFKSILQVSDSTIVKLLRYLFFSLATLFWLQLKNFKGARFVKRQPLYRSMIVVLFAWSLYYFFIYAGYNSNESLGLLDYFAKHHRMVIGIFAFFFTAQVVAVGDLKPFFNFFTTILIIVGLLSLITAFTGLNLVEVGQYERHFTSVKRIIFQGGKIIYFILPLAAAHLALNYKKDYKIYTAFVFIISMIVIAILRRWMVGAVVYSILVFMLMNYIRSRPLIVIPKKTFITLSGLIVAFVLFLGVLKKEYLSVISDTAINLIEIAQGDIDERTADDDRISFTKQSSMFKAFTDNLVLGTGYDDRWFNNRGKDDQWEGADYIFLGVMGQYGIAGMLIFFFYYVVVLTAVFKGLKLLRRNWNWFKLNILRFHLNITLFLAASVEFLRNLIEYPNWFVPISASSFGYLFFIYGGMVVGSYLFMKGSIENRNKELRIKYIAPNA